MKGKEGIALSSEHVMGTKQYKMKVITGGLNGTHECETCSRASDIMSSNHRYEKLVMCRSVSNSSCRIDVKNGLPVEQPSRRAT